MQLLHFYCNRNSIVQTLGFNLRYFIKSLISNIFFWLVTLCLPFAFTFTARRHQVAESVLNTVCDSYHDICYNAHCRIHKSDFFFIMAMFCSEIFQKKLYINTLVCTSNLFYFMRYRYFTSFFLLIQ